MKTERKAKISFGKMGNGKGSRINLSIPLLKTLGITEENREVLVIYDDDAKTITIKRG